MVTRYFTGHLLSARWRRRFMLRDRFDDGVGAVAFGEDLIRDAANIRLRDSVDLVELTEEFAPVAVAKLVGSQALCQPLVVAERAQQIDARTRLEHGQFIVGDVLVSSACRSPCGSPCASPAGVWPGSGTA